jgi:transcriptional regulator with GAF, ATPase, and Fis domain
MADRSGVQAAVDALAADLGCSVLVEDAQHEPLWWSAQEAVDEVRVHTILQHRVAPEAAAMVRRLNLSRAVEPVRTPQIREIGMRERWCVPIRSDGVHLGYLWVEDAGNQVGPGQLPLLQQCADLAAEVLGRQRSAHEDLGRQRSALLDRLLHGPEEQAARELAALERLPHDVTIVVRVPAQRSGWPVPGGMSAHVWRAGAAPAASGTALPLIELGEAVRRAACTRRALAAGARLDRPSWDALGAWRLVADAPAGLSIAEIHPGAETLASLPRADLMLTARAVLDHGGDVAAAAEALHIHRTTLYYRLDRIQALIGADLRAGPGRTDLQLALWLAAYRRADG